MEQIVIDVNPETLEWLKKRALVENCTVEDFASVIVTAVCINSQINQLKNETETVIQEA